ncbi:hypothetical protein D3C80_1890770 [compost metagenome]
MVVAVVSMSTLTRNAIYSCIFNDVNGVWFAAALTLQRSSKARVATPIFPHRQKVDAPLLSAAKTEARAFIVSLLKYLVSRLC